MSPLPAATPSEGRRVLATRFHGLVCSVPSIEHWPGRPAKCPHFEVTSQGLQVAVPVPCEVLQAFSPLRPAERCLLGGVPPGRGAVPALGVRTPGPRGRAARA